MKKLLLLCACLMALTTTARAEYIVIYADQAGTQCSLAYAISAPVYVFDYFGYSASGAKFRFDTTNAPGTTLLWFTSPYSFTGDANSLISMDYGGCVSAQGPAFMIGTLYLNAACGSLAVTDVTLIDCQHQETTGNYGWFLNICGPPTCPPDASERSTWGSVKSLYR
jgi:hypothetical protein